MSINMSKEQKEMLPYIIKTIIDMNWINQDKLPDAYRGSDNDVVVYKEKK